MSRTAHDELREAVLRLVLDALPTLDVDALLSLAQTLAVLRTESDTKATEFVARIVAELDKEAEEQRSRAARA